MYNIKVSAPGKLFLSGEYAVLEGAPAVIDSVDRRVLAESTRENIPQSTLVKEVRQEVTAFLSARSGSAVGQMPNVDIDSTGFSVSKRKLGIGSSAAVAAAAAGALFEWAGVSIDSHRADIFRVADEAHRRYQQGKGSGADVATSILGGTVIFRVGEEPVQAASLQLHKVFVWTGKSASTVSLVDAVKKMQVRFPSVYDAVMGELVRLAHAIAQGYRLGDAAQVVALTGAYGAQMNALGEAAGTAIVTHTMKHIGSIASANNGAFKPSGAGGGDAAMAIFSTADDAAKFVSKIRADGLDVLDFQTGVPGLRKE